MLTRVGGQPGRFALETIRYKETGPVQATPAGRRPRTLCCKGLGDINTHTHTTYFFQQLLIFHYDFEGVATAVKCLPSVEKRTGSVFDLQSRALPPLMEDSAGNHIALISHPLPWYSASLNPAAAALFSWRYMCLANNCEPLIITTEDSTLEHFTLRPDLEQTGVTFTQSVTQIRITI